MIVDSCVLIDIFTKDPEWYQWSSAILTTQYQNNVQLRINPIIFSEIGLNFDSSEDLTNTVSMMKIIVEERSPAALFPVSRAYFKYKREHTGNKSNVLPDFFIGAHAADIGVYIITRDIKKFKTYFPGVKLISS